MENPIIHHTITAHDPHDEDRTQRSGLPPRVFGVVALVLMFFVGMAIVWAYLAGTPRTAQAAHQIASSTVSMSSSSAPLDAQRQAAFFANVQLIAHAAIVVDLSTHTVLYQLNPDAQLPLASLTKVPMALAVSQALPTDTVITIPYDTAPSGSVERLPKGSKWKLQDVIDFTLMASSNGGAEILAASANDAVRSRYPDAPEKNATVWRMNNLAQELGLTHTYFLNASGLDESTTQAGSYGSPRDIATLFAYAASTSPKVFAATAKDGTHFVALDGAKTVAYNTNQALGAIPGIVMGKTGYTDLAGGNLAVVFDAGVGHRVVAVVMNSTESGRFDDMKVLVNAVLEAIKK